MSGYVQFTPEGPLEYDECDFCGAPVRIGEEVCIDCEDFICRECGEHFDDCECPEEEVVSDGPQLELPALEAVVLAAKQRGEACCLGCRCTDSQACAGGCSWILVDYRRGIGVCSNCARGVSS